MLQRFSKMHYRILFALVLMVGLALALPAFAGHGKAKPAKKAILLVTFGTSVPQAAKVFDNIDKMAKVRFPGVEIRWAYTSVIIRKKLARQGQVMDSPALALVKLADEGYTHVAVQSLHMIPGQEFHDLRMTTASLTHGPEGLKKMTLGLPLLTSAGDMDRVAKAVLADLPPERTKDEAVVLMGHGTHHPANAAYPAMAFFFSLADPKVFMGTVEGFPDLETVESQLKASGTKKVWLLPFMSVAGDHAMNDLAGDEDDSWKSILTAKGYTCRPVLKGLAANPVIVDVWLDHLAKALEKL